MFPISEETVAFAHRFGFEYLTGFNMTEVSAPLVTDVNTDVYGSCGKPRTGIQARLVDDHDIEVPRGEIGELIVRSQHPWSMNAGYNGQPEATAAAWRNGWFHTGDLFRQDDDGNFFFVDRKKDTIRRRGENISSFEVENSVRQFADVDEVAAVGVESEIAEQEVMVVVTSQARTNGGSPRAHRVPDPAPALLHGAAVRPRRRRKSRRPRRTRSVKSTSATRASRPTPGTVSARASSCTATGFKPEPASALAPESRSCAAGR